jgi:hypothetical protein
MTRHDANKKVCAGDYSLTIGAQVHFDIWLGAREPHGPQCGAGPKAFVRARALLIYERG